MSTPARTHRFSIVIEFSDSPDLIASRGSTCIDAVIDRLEREGARVIDWHRVPMPTAPTPVKLKGITRVGASRPLSNGSQRGRRR